MDVGVGVGVVEGGGGDGCLVAGVVNIVGAGEVGVASRFRVLEAVNF